MTVILRAMALAPLKVAVERATDGWNGSPISTARVYADPTHLR
jgi:hypothetical protein